MPSIEDLILPDKMIPDIDSSPTDEFEDNQPEEEEEVDEAVVGMIVEMLSYPIVTVEDLAFGLEEDEFTEKYQKYKNRAIQTGFAKNIARYLEESGLDWMNDPRIALAISGIMYFLFVAIDFKQTMDKKKKKREVEKRIENAIDVNENKGGEKE